jgi:DNA-binding transcriptional ArsR family regulator
MMSQEPDLAAVAALIAQPSRASILAALLGGELLPATELAYRAHITPQTASSHLTKLLEGNLITVTSVGRHRYYSLKSHEVARILETLQMIAPPTKRYPPQAAKISPELCQARTCYDHLAGRLGVAFTDALLLKNYLMSVEQGYHLTAEGTEWFAAQQIDVETLKKVRRRLAYPCLDWSERRFHLAGSLGAAVAALFFEQRWIKRLPHTRAIELTPAGEKMLQRQFGLHL